MTKIKKWKLILAATLAALLAATFGLALHLATRSTSAVAAEVEITVETDGNGTVAYGGQTSGKEPKSQITVKANAGEQVTLTATPEEGHVFAYWYEDDINKPLCGIWDIVKRFLIQLKMKPTSMQNFLSKLLRL